MSTSRLFFRLKAWFRRGRRADDLSEELQFHLQNETQRNIASGMSPEESRYAALRSFGGVDQVKEKCQDLRRMRFFDELWQDMKYNSRMLRRNPGFTAVAVLTLGLGIGANSAIFTVVNAVLLRPLPFEDSDQLVNISRLGMVNGALGRVCSAPYFMDVSNRNQVFQNVGAMTLVGGFTLEGGDFPEQIRGSRASSSFFSVLKVKAALGRTFSPGEERIGHDRVVLLSDGLWRRRFGADPHVIGLSLRLNNEDHTVVGVLPSSLKHYYGALDGGEVDAFLPLVLGQGELRGRGFMALWVVARLKAGVTLAQARADLDVLANQLELEYPTESGTRAKTILMKEAIVGDTRSASAVILSAVGLILLIACANVANLLLARAATRTKEISLRIALGAGRGRLIRQFLSESLGLSALGGLLGLLLSYWGLKLLLPILPPNVPRIDEIGVDGTVLSFTLGTSLLAGIVFGMAPALATSKLDLTSGLKEMGRTLTRTRNRCSLRGSLIVSEIGLAMVLLISAGLMIKSFWLLLNVPLGFDPVNVLSVGLSLSPVRYSEHHQRSAFQQQLLERIGKLPGVQHVATATNLPPGGEGIRTRLPFSLDWNLPQIVGDEPQADYVQVSPEYFLIMGIPVREGSVFTPQDDARSKAVAVINQTMAQRFWPDRSAIGQRIQIFSYPEQVREIVGVVSDVRNKGLDTQPEAQVYVPYLQDPSGYFSLVLRTAVDPGKMAALIRTEILALDSFQRIGRIITMEQRLLNSVNQPRFYALVSGSFAILALFLALVGIYGVISYSVTQRTQEVGIRMSLGAQPSDVLKLVLMESFQWLCIGIPLGWTTAFALTRVFSSVLFGVTATDPATFIGLGILMIGIALAASYIPARRATKVDPLVALRYE